jgi:BirA family biotin operon repressor/biotin-[acetyl-CoA-carboxylase] ligase
VRQGLKHAGYEDSAFGRLQAVQQTGSTNADLLDFGLAGSREWPDLSVLTAEIQTEGRGRLGRRWTAPVSSSLMVSLLLRPTGTDGRPLPMTAYAWTSMLSALAFCDAVRESTGVRADIKWPNDVLVKDRKLAGILAQLNSSSDGHDPFVVVGMGANVSLTRAELPVETATSLLLEGVESLDRNMLLASYLAAFRTLYRDFCAVEGNPLAPLTAGASLSRRVQDAMVTLGQRVRAELPGDGEVVGTATGLDEHGSLLITDDGGRAHAVSAGDVIHLRRGGPAQETSHA